MKLANRFAETSHMRYSIRTAAAMAACGLLMPMLMFATPQAAVAEVALPRAVLGARSLPSTFVRLESKAFPKPAKRACKDNRRVINVPSAKARTITDGLAKATPGTTVRVRRGTYTENSGDSFALQASRNNVCLRARSGRVTLRAAPGQNYGLLLSGNDLAVQGFRLVGFAYNVSLGASQGTTQRRVTIEDSSIVAAGGSWSEGIIAYPDNRSSPGSPPTVDGLLLRNVTVAGTDLGISCNAGPCAHWWLENVQVQGVSRSDDSGADNFAIENGRQIVVVNSTFSGAAADGIDTKATDVVVSGSRVVDAQRNGIKLWNGGDVINSVVDGSGADAALVGDAGGRYRYSNVEVRRHDPSGTGYVGTWGYDTQEPIQLEIINSVFANNSSGGLYVPAVTGTSVSIRSTRFADVGTKLLDFGGSREFLTTQSGLDALSQAGLGSGNSLGGP